MEIQKYQISDRQKIAGKFFIGIFIAIAAYLVLTFVVPWATLIAWNVTKMAIATAVMAIVLYVLWPTSKFWTALRILGGVIARYTIGLFISMDYWGVLEEEIKGAEQDRDVLGKEVSRLTGRVSDMESEMSKYEKTMKQSAASIKILSNTGQLNESQQLQYEEQNNIFINAKAYIDGVAPTYKNLKSLIEHWSKVYDRAEYTIRGMWVTLGTQKDLYKAVTSGANAAARALRLFTGRKDLQDNSRIALEQLRENMAQKIGEIKTSVRLTSKFMDQKDLENAAKVQMAVDTMKAIDNDKDYSYQAQVAKSAPIMVENTKGNKYLSSLKK